MPTQPLNFPIACQHHVCWGQDGLTYYGAFFKAIVIVDVLSFCTTLDLALSKGSSIIPTKIEHEDELLALSKHHHAILAKKRTEEGVTLSPSSMQYVESNQTILLPSPNGSTLGDIASQFGKPVFAGCFRNSQALAHALNVKGYFPILFVAAGERYPNKGLRPSIEDYWGVGSILARLHGAKTLEADYAMHSYLAASKDLKNNLIACESGLELVLKNFRQDVELAAELDISTTICLLVKRNGCWQFKAQTS